MSTGDGQAWHIEPAEVRELSRKLLAAADALSGAASPLDREMPAVPEDEHGLSAGFNRFDDARGAFDRRLADVCRKAGNQLALVVIETVAADVDSPFVHLPEAGY